MKKSLILFFVTSFISLNSYSQSSDSLKIPSLITGGGHNFEIIGNESLVYKDSLFSHFEKKPTNRYIWKFKNVEIPGISGTVTLQVHQGLKGYTDEPRYDANKCGGSAYFYTFTSEKRKTIMLQHQSESEYPALVIYVKRGKRYGVDEDEVEYLKSYLRSIYEG